MAQYSFQYRIKCDGNVVDTATVTGDINVTATANDDMLGDQQVGIDRPIDVSINDVPCSNGAVTTYQLKAGTESNCTVAGVGPDFSVTPLGVGAFSFQYDILCDGSVVDSATVSGTGVTPTADAVDDDAGLRQPGEQFTFDVSTNDTGCTLGAPTTYELVPGSEQNCTVAIDPNTGVATVTISQ